jgi:outer membrane protein OmpA-like peptidoglycan-associated protein
VKEEKAANGYISAECAKIYLYDITNLPEKVLLSEIKCTAATEYKFTLLANKKYQIEAEKNGFKTQQTNISTNGLRKKETEQVNIKLDRIRTNSPVTPNPVAPKVYKISGCVYIEDNAQRTAVEDAELVIYEIDNKSEVEIERMNITNCYDFDLAMGSNYRIVAYKKGFITGHIDLSTRTGSKGYKDIYLKPKRKNAIFKLENVYYDLGVATLRPESEVSLNQLVKMMKDNPNLIIEIDSHTDSRGSAEANRILSQNRAQSVVNYLVDNGVSAKRLQAKGLGESQPVNKCKDSIPCTEEEYQLNRRTEFKILGETNE